MTGPRLWSGVGLVRSPKRTITLGAALVTLGVAGLPAAHAQSAPAVVAVPGGVYSGSVQIDGVRCGGRCRLRLVVSEDGLEVRRASTVLGGGVVRGCQGGTLETAFITANRRWRSAIEDELGALPLRGRFSRDGRRVAGTGSIRCRRETRLRFSARLVSRRRAPTGKVVACERLKAARGVMVLAVQRDVGCGRARHAARELVTLESCRPVAEPGGACEASGLRCAATGAGEFDPAAQVRCTPPEVTAPAGASVELVRFAACGRSAGGAALSYAANGVDCLTARRLADEWAECEEDTCAIGEFSCAATSERPWARCVATTDARRVVEVFSDPSDVV